MNKLHISIKIIIFFMLIGLQLAIIALIHMPYSKTVTETGINNVTITIREYIILSQDEYFIIFLIVSIVSMFFGMFFINIFRSWTYLDLIGKLDNPIFIDDAILALYKKRLSLKTNIPSFMKLIITDKEK